MLAADSSSRKQTAISDLISRLTVASTTIKISIKGANLLTVLSNRPSDSSASRDRENDISIEAPFAWTDRTEVTKLLIADRDSHEPDPVVVKAMARAHQWFEQLVTGKAQSMADIAARENITDNYVSNLVHLAWLSPRQVELILEGNPTATRSARNSMLTRSVDVLWPH